MSDLTRFRNGDREHFTVVVRTHASLVRHVALSFAIDGDHADDLFQAIWVQIYQKASSYTGGGSIEAWIHRVATNFCITEHRSRKARRDMQQRFAGEATPEQAGSHFLDPISHTEQAEIHEKLHRALAYLSDREHQAVTLRILEGRSPEETAEIMGITPATVRSNIRFAVKRLRAMMEDPGEDLSRFRSTC